MPEKNLPISCCNLDTKICHIYISRENTAKHMNFYNENCIGSSVSGNSSTSSSSLSNPHNSSANVTRNTYLRPSQFSQPSYLNQAMEAYNAELIAKFTNQLRELRIEHDHFQKKISNDFRLNAEHAAKPRIKTNTCNDLIKMLESCDSEKLRAIYETQKIAISLKLKEKKPNTYKATISEVLNQINLGHFTVQKKLQVINKYALLISRPKKTNKVETFYNFIMSISHTNEMNYTPKNISITKDKSKLPFLIKFSDPNVINEEYKHINDHIVQFKVAVYDAVGITWFLPGSMDDLGQICLNATLADTNISTVKKMFKTYRKVHFAYHAYMGNHKMMSSLFQLKSVLREYAPKTQKQREELSRDNISKSSSSSQIPDISVGFGEKLLIGSGRAFVKTGQGIKQLGLSSGEKLGIVEAGTTASYTEQINQEKELYNNTPIGQSMVAKSGEILTEIAISVAIPGGSGSTGPRLVAESAAAGAIVGGMQATEDGSLYSRAENAAISAVECAAGGYVFSKTSQGLHWAWKEGKVKYGLYTFDKKAEVTHVFAKAKGGKAPKDGHVYDTPENRKIILETFSDKKNFIGKDIHGKELFAKLLPDGTETWAYVQNGKVKSAGINNIPLYYNIDGCLIKNNRIISKGPKP